MINIKRLLIKHFNIIYIFIPFIIITVLSGIISLYTTHEYNSYISQFIESLETAKNIQIELQKQFNNGKIIILEGISFNTYQHKIHEYSYNAQNIQNQLFNLGIMCKDMKGIHVKIIKFTNFYKQVNNEFLSYIVNYNDLDFYSSKNIINNSFANEQKLLQMMEDIVSDIDKVSNEKIQYINKYYLTGGFISIGLLTIFALVVSWFSARLFNRFKEKLETKVQRRTEQLQKTNDKLSLSEQKYRFLIESTDDMIFTMSEQGEIFTINKSVNEYLKLKSSAVIGNNFYDYLYFDNDNDVFKKQMLKKNIERSLYDKKKMGFYAEFKTNKMIEPIEMFVTLESVTTNGRMEIIGKASKIIENEIIDSFLYEHVKYEISNSLLLADEITHRIILNVKKFLPHNAIAQLRLVISELLINAIEHGNLDITYEDKLLKLQDDVYFDYMTQKINEKDNKDKKIKVEFMVNSERIVIKISDQGKGFDHKKYLSRSAEQITEESLLQHGRGILLARQIFDEIKYNDKGNQVLCIKYFNPVEKELHAHKKDQILLS
ncbi:MAG TPA: ATP-binding protein [Spirochaetota bacterium]|nr:ATP-binding protein [Spirochaetota bacterium]HOR93091.1 ATP-binding protein [Spirochaetota bacterium]HPD05284.1 ATP-binding protein [Spirochaetota bacterium]HQI38886.1 ATP-binding protein [Spirochaetota bacterium]HQK08012.1 ATP-binding protein [Spirochaetota bacterium]